MSFITMDLELNLKEILAISDVSEASSCDEEEQVVLSVKFKKKTKQVTAMSLVKHFEIVYPSFTKNQFKLHFRITTEMFEEIMSFLSPIIGDQNQIDQDLPDGNLKKKLLAILWFLASPDSFESVADRFNMTDENLLDDFIEIIYAINEIAKTIIKWPKIENKLEIKRSFQDFGGIRDVIGVIDQTYIPICTPTKNPETCSTSRCQSVISLQCVAIPTLQFTLVEPFCGTRIFQNSRIYKAFQYDFDKHCAGGFMLADKAYPLLPWLIPPYSEGPPLTPTQLNFNAKHSSTHQVIERSFALLFGRFRRLNYLDNEDANLNYGIVKTCCVLHNICVGHEEIGRDEYINEGREFIKNNNDKLAIADQNINVRDVLAQELYLN